MVGKEIERNKVGNDGISTGVPKNGTGTGNGTRGRTAVPMVGGIERNKVGGDGISTGVPKNGTGNETRERTAVPMVGGIEKIEVESNEE
jgi:hypothetical protein